MMQQAEGETRSNVDALREQTQTERTTLYEGIRGIFDQRTEHMHAVDVEAGAAVRTLLLSYADQIAPLFPEARPYDYHISIPMEHGSCRVDLQKKTLDFGGRRAVNAADSGLEDFFWLPLAGQIANSLTNAAARMRTRARLPEGI